MPAEKCRRLDEDRPPSRLRQHLAERRQQGTISRPQARPADLAPQHHKLMPQHEYLDLLRPLRTTKENEKLEQTANHPISEGQALKQQTPSTHLSMLSRSKHADLRLRLHQPGEPAETAREFLGPTRRDRDGQTDNGEGAVGRGGLSLLHTTKPTTGSGSTAPARRRVVGSAGRF
jgi:hypothetical protein